jgi:TM2 domain-containing membrane protein YozV
MMKNRIIAIVIAALFGQFGIHYFYLGDRDKGLLALLFSWTFIPRLVSFIDLVRYAKMSDEEFNQRYNLPSPVFDKFQHPLKDLRQSWEQIRNNIHHSTPQGQYTQQVQSGQYVADELHKLSVLMDKGLLTFEEFERRKAMLLKRS